MKTRISKFSDPARGGRKIEMLTSSRHTTVMWPDGVCSETYSENWKDIGTIMEPITNHVPEQPASRAKKMLQARLDEQRS